MGKDNFLVQDKDPKYGFLKELGLETVNEGVYHGKWTGNGEVSRLVDEFSILVHLLLALFDQCCQPINQFIIRPSISLNFIEQ